MISYLEAKKLVVAEAKSFGIKKISLNEAAGRVIAEKIIADRSYPPFNRAMMDGIAINIQDWNNGIRTFILKETIYAGKQSAIEIASGECYKIMTGAAVPLSADVVIRKEDLRWENDTVMVEVDQVMPFQSIARKGEDLQQDEVIIDSPIRCNTAVAALLASVGRHEVLVEKLPRVAVVTTGDEVVDIHLGVKDVQIRNSNAYVLKSLLKEWNIFPMACYHVADDKVRLQETISELLENDILIINGGVSAGDADYVPDVLKELEVAEIFHKVAIRPGKPIWFGKLKNGAVVFALPGNPFSCMVTFKLFIEPYLLACFKINSTTEITLPFSGTRQKKSGLDEFFPVKISGAPAQFVPLPFNSSGDITAALFADALVWHPAEKKELLTGDILVGKML